MRYVWSGGQFEILRGGYVCKVNVVSSTSTTWREPRMEVEFVSSYMLKGGACYIGGEDCRR